MQVLRFSQTPQISNSGVRAAVWSSVVSRWFACALRLRTTGLGGLLYALAVRNYYYLITLAHLCSSDHTPVRSMPGATVTASQMGVGWGHAGHLLVQSTPDATA